MQRRTFLKLSTTTALAGLVPPLVSSCATSNAGAPIDAVMFSIRDGRVAFDGDGRRYAIASLDGVVTELDAFGSPIAQLSPGASLNVPVAIASNGNGPRFLLSKGDCEVHRLGPDGAIEATFGGYGSSDGKLSYPSALAVDSHGNVYVCDTLNHRIQVFDVDGNALVAFGVGGLGAGELNAPTDLCFGPNGDLYVANTGNGTVERFSANGTHRGSFSGPRGRFVPTGIGLRPYGDLVVSDASAGVLHVFDLDGTHLRTEETFDGTSRVQPVTIAIEPSTGRVVVAAEGVG